MIDLFIISITIGFFVAIALIAYRETTYWYYKTRDWIGKSSKRVPKFPTFFQIRDWFYIRKYKRKELPDLILKTRSGDQTALAKRIKNAKNVTSEEKYRNKQKYL